MDDHGNEATSLSVSVLLDISGSMHHHMLNLSVAAYAIHKGCREVNVPCNTVLWSDGATLLWGKDDEATPVLLTSYGGTSPKDALVAAQYQGNDKRHHLVFVLTDGQWSYTDIALLTALEEENRHIFLFGFGEGVNIDQFSKACTEALALDDLSRMPTIVSSLITDFIGK
jgi:hypothetical protein